MYFLAFLAILIGSSVTSYALDSEYLPDPLIKMDQNELPCDDACEGDQLENEELEVFILSDSVSPDRVLKELDLDEIRGHFFTPIEFENMRTFKGCLLIEHYKGAYLAICGDHDLERLEQRIGYLRFLLKQRDLGDGAQLKTGEYYRVSIGKYGGNQGSHSHLRGPYHYEWMFLE